MERKQQHQTVNMEENATELLPRNPYCSNDGAPCVCRLPNITLQPQWVAAKPWSLWKTFLVCLLACLIAAALVVLVLYFVQFGKPTNGSTNIIINSDGKSNPVTCIPGSTPSLTLPTLPGSQSTQLSTPMASQSSSTTVLPSTMEMTKTTVDHNVDIEYDEEHS